MAEQSLSKSGAVTGIIYPPPDVRSIVDKTAEFVARNGVSFEHRIKAKESSNIKFEFLNDDNPYNAYYKFKVSEIKSGISSDGTEKEELKEPEKTDDTEKTETAEKTKAIVKKAKHSVAGIYANLAKNLSDEPPKPDQFTIVHQRLAPVDRAIIKLTAQYTAVSGRQFLSGLARKEAGNPQFEFLKPTHVLFQYFTALCDQYAKLLNPSKDLTDKIGAGVTDRMKILQRCVHKLEFKRKSDRERAEKEASESKEKMVYQSIDWHDFVVVETIEFGDDDEALPPPLPQQDDDAMDMDMDTDMDMDDDKPPTAPSTVETSTSSRTNKPSYNFDEDIKVRSDYKPTHTNRNSGPKFMVDERTGEKIDINRSAEHVRISLVDPRYKEQQARAREKSKETPMARDEQIAANLKSLSQARPDIFGGDEFEADSKRAAPKSAGSGDDKVIWDGHTASVSAVQQQAMERQLEQIKKRQMEKGGTANPDIGPAQPNKGVAPGATYMQPPQHVAQPPPPALSAPPPAPASGRMMPPNTGAPVTGMPPPPPPTYQNPVPPPQRPLPVAPPRPMAPAPMYQPRGMVGMHQAMPPMHGMHQMPQSGMPRAAPVSNVNTSGTNLVPEAEWIKNNPGPTQVNVQVPNDSNYSNWNFNGQKVSTSLPATATVRDLKKALSSLLGDMPFNKQQLKHPRYGFMKDAKTLAHYNISSSNVLSLVPRKRGRR